MVRPQLDHTFIQPPLAPRGSVESGSECAFHKLAVVVVGSPTQRLHVPQEHLIFGKKSIDGGVGEGFVLELRPQIRFPTDLRKPL